MRCGLIAQEVEKVIPEVVVGEDWDYNPETQKVEMVEGDYKTMNYIELIPVLIKAIQEQNIYIQKLENRIEVMEKNN